MAGMGGMGGGAGFMGSMIDTGIQGAQNTSKQEYNQRQALFQNLVASADDSAWLMQHFPNFANWTPTGGGTGGYQAGSSAPQAYAGNKIESNFAGNMGADANRKQQQPVLDANVSAKKAEAAYYDYLRGQGGGSGSSSSGYSSLWS